MTHSPLSVGFREPFTIPSLFEQAFASPSAAKWDWLVKKLIWLRVCYKDTSESLKPTLLDLEVIARWERNHSPDFVPPSLNQLNFQQP